MIKLAKNTPLRLGFLLILGLLFSLNSLAQETEESKTVKLFRSEELLNIRIEADFKSIFKNTDDTTNFAAVLSYHEPSGEKVEIDVEMRTRGKQRRIECNFMPLRLELNKKDVKGTLFSKQATLKLITHCRKPSVYEQNTRIEYLIYKALNIITDTSFKVRPFMVNYVYNGKKVDSIQKFGFVMERFKHMAERLDMVTFKKINFHANRTYTDYMNLIDVFQFMIGNTDYSVYKLHNIKLIIDPFEHRFPMAIPYDFDWSGMVSADYARPNEFFGTKKVSDRVYRGFELEREALSRVFKRFNDKKEEILALFANDEILKKSEKKRLRAYLRDFYKVINKKDAVDEFIKVSRSLEI